MIYDRNKCKTFFIIELANIGSFGELPKEVLKIFCQEPTIHPFLNHKGSACTHYDSNIPVSDGIGQSTPSNRFRPYNNPRAWSSTVPFSSF
jgi:hypothetical protein